MDEMNANSPAEALRQISPEAFAALGLPNLAYVKPVESKGTVEYEIHAANGERIGVAPSHETAVAAVIQHDLEPVNLH
jgi:hypothetical protein